MKVRINRDSIFCFKQSITDADGNLTGKEKDGVQFSISFPDYPLLPSASFGVVIDLPVNKASLEAKIKELTRLAKQQTTANENTRKVFESLGFIGEFEIKEE